MEKLAQIKWGRGKFSEVFRSNIIDPSPLKAGQKVKVVWGESKREYAAVVECDVFFLSFSPKKLFARYSCTACILLLKPMLAMRPRAFRN